jgi:hypothetical protein
MATAPPSPQPDDDAIIDGVEDETDEQPTEETVEFDFSAADTPPPRPRPRTATKPKGSLKEVAVPLLFTIGVILLIPAIWGTLILTGKLESTRASAKGMATAMLVCYPVSACLIAGGVLFLRQVMKEKARHAKVINKE